MIKNKEQVPFLEISESERNSSMELMRSIFEVQSVSGDMDAMKIFLYTFIANLSDPTITINSDDLGNIYVTKGRADTYPCIVSHIDTVHDIIPQEEYMVLDNGIEFFAIDLGTRSPTGIGADDNNGIYTCLDNLIREDEIKLAFFVDEEIGCVGSRSCDMDFFLDVSFVLQADRKGYEDVVDNISGTKMFGMDFFDAIADDLDNYCRNLSDGGMTDVMQLAHNGLEVAMANFSCGYYKPHSNYEYVVIDELILTSLLFRDIIKSAYSNGLVNEYQRDVYEDRYSGWGYGAEFDDFDDSDPFALSGSTVSLPKPKKKNKDEDVPCTFCGSTLEYDETMDAHYCHDCFDYDYNQ